MKGRKRGDGTFAEDKLHVYQVKNQASLAHPDGSRPIVFLNACQAGQAGRTLTGTGGMADAFIRRGAGLFVGTLWSIGDGTALTFADTFYDRLKAGATVSQATRAAREAAKKADEPTWLAYTVYGHPYARLQ
jgi:CHAT domain-containing protein